MTLHQDEKDFITEVKRLIKENPDATFRLFIGDVFKEKVPTANISVSNYETAKYIIEQISKDVLPDDKSEDFKDKSPVEIFFVIYEKNQTHL